MRLDYLWTQEEVIMKKRLLPIVLAVLELVCPPVHAEQEAEDVLKAIVKVRAIVPPDARTATSLGTQREGNGVVIDSDGHILTIGYLILEAETIELTDSNGNQIAASFIGYDHSTGFGILRAHTPLKIKPMMLGESSAIKPGDPVLVAGHGGAEAVSGVRVVSRSEFAGYWEYLLEDAIFTMPPYLNYGGAALIGRGGRLVGIGSLYTQVTVSGLGTVPSNMFVPIDPLKPILDDLVKTGRSNVPPQPWLGINVKEAHGRVFVIRVTSGSPAETAGLKPDDLILMVKEAEVKGMADFFRKVWALGGAGIDVPLSILRGVRIQDITVRSADRYQFLQPKGEGKTRSSSFKVQKPYSVG